jgi:serine/threonine-protein kinase
LKVVGLIAGGVGIVGLGLGAGFGLAALSFKSAHCDSSGTCDPGTSQTAYDRGTVSTVGFVAGGVLLGLGVTLFLVAPSGGTEHPAASVTVGPMVGSSAGGLRLGGTW